MLPSRTQGVEDQQTKTEPTKARHKRVAEVEPIIPITWQIVMLFLLVGKERGWVGDGNALTVH